MYAEIAPVKRVRKVAGMRALGALPKAAIPVQVVGRFDYIVVSETSRRISIIQFAMLKRDYILLVDERNIFDSTHLQANSKHQHQQYFLPS